jgi:CxxC motif-containing protein (DUF1111 family)
VITLLALAIAVIGSNTQLIEAAETTTKKKADGAELFAREWLPGDSRASGGDGLGPMFNASSCISCHNQGGVGGGGPKSKNVEILTASVFQAGHVQNLDVHDPFAEPPPSVVPQSQVGTNQLIPAVPLPHRIDIDERALRKEQEEQQKRAIEQQRQQRKESIEALKRLHPGFSQSRSVVLHRFGTSEGYDEWRQRAKFGQVNTPNETQQSADELLLLDAVLESASFNQGSVTVPHGFPADRSHFFTSPSNTALSFNSLLDRMHTLANTAHTRAQSQVSRANIGQHVSLQSSQRNATALFGAGLIDSISDETLLLASKKRYKNYPHVSGRLSRLENGRVGKFGWKSQIASLRDFTLTACAVELGLNVPGHAQAGIPQRPDYKTNGLDLTQAECNALISYLAKLPAPVETKSASKENGEFIASGHKLFDRVGCAACHTPELGEVTGIYSDLLLHDMGPQLGDIGSSYGVFRPQAPGSPDAPLPELVDAAANGKSKKKKNFGATQLEWRTPPLWGVRDSAPYMHDGRADTLEEAIAAHGGEGLKSAQMYFALLPNERMQVLAMLRSLVAKQ